MRVVADTNTIVSAFLWGGLPAEILSAARERRISLYTSPMLLAELEDVLAREKFATRISKVGSSAAQMIAGYRSLATPVRPVVVEPTARVKIHEAKANLPALAARAEAESLNDRVPARRLERLFAKHRPVLSRAHGALPQ